MIRVSSFRAVICRARKVKTARCQSTNIYHNRTVHHSYWRQAVVASFTTAALQNAAHTRRSTKSDFETIRWIQLTQLLEFQLFVAKISRITLIYYFPSQETFSTFENSSKRKNKTMMSERGPFPEVDCVKVDLKWSRDDPVRQIINYRFWRTTKAECIFHRATVWCFNFGLICRPRSDRN